MEENVNGLIQEAKKLCPVFFPSIFPQSFYPRSVIDIFNKTEDQEIDDLFRLPACFCTEYSFTKKEILITQIKICSELDSILSNPHKVMQQLQSESFEKADILSARFFELNEYPDFENVLTQRHQFVKIYSILYSIRTLLSNIPGLRIRLGNHEEHYIPLQSCSVEATTFIKQLMNRNDDSEVQKPLDKKKKNKRKRSSV